MQQRKLIFIISTVIFAALFISACTGAATPVSTETPEKGIPSTGATPSATAESPTQSAAPIEQSVQELARQLGVDITAIKVESVTAQDWPDACLDAPRGDESCAMVITPGYKIVLDVGGVKYEIHTDQTGGNIRVIPGAVGEAMKALAAKLGVSVDTLRALNVEKMTWNDACLDVRSPKQVCAQVVTPGYQVQIDANGKTYVYHTDESGKNVLLAEVPLPDMGSAPLVFSETTELGCEVVGLESDKLTFGPCDGNLTTIPFPLDINNTILGNFVKEFASFDVDVAGGKLKFKGEGTQTATPAQQRMIAEWARLTRQIAETGAFDPTLGRVLVWHREGGIAGFCDDLSIYITGMALATSCKGTQQAGPEPVFLGVEDLDQFYSWIDSVKSFNYQHADVATADAMKTSLQFEGQGEQQASDQVEQNILDFAMRVYQQATTGQLNK